MAYFKPATPDELTPEQRSAVKFHTETQGNMTNMKWTLLHHVPSFAAYMDWYVLRDGLLEFISEREFSLFSYAISTTNDCLVCSTFFRRILIDSGDDPDHLDLSGREQLLWELGQAIVNDPHQVPEAVYSRLAALFNEKQSIQLFAFAGSMVATNLFVTLARVDLDEVLYKYRKKENENES